MSGKIIVILVLWLFLLSATATLITDAKESSKIVRSQNNMIEVKGNLAPVLSYDPTSHDFGDKYKGEFDSTTFEIWNSGCCILRYSLYENCSWVDVNPTSGSGSSSGEHDTISVSVDTSDLASGYHSCKISITSNGGRGDFTVSLALGDGYTDITVEEAWALLNDTSNGIQIPIDVRFDVEWAEEHIDTPPPENPRHSCVCSWSNETTLQEFMSLIQRKGDYSVL